MPDWSVLASVTFIVWKASRGRDACSRCDKNGCPFDRQPSLFDQRRSRMRLATGTRELAKGAFSCSDLRN